MDKTKQRVVVTGFGSVTAVGHDVMETWENLLAGKSGIAPIQSWPMETWNFKLGAEIKNYNPRQLIADRKLLKLITRPDVLGINSVKQALEQSALLQYRDSLANPIVFNERTGIYVGSPGNKYYQQYDFIPLFAQAKNDLQKFGKDLFDVVHPMWLLQILPNNVLAYAGIQHGFKGPNENIVNHGVSSTQAIGEAFHAIQRGDIDRAVVIGYESAIEPQGQLYYGELGVLSKQDLKPFDRNRDGTILGEGAGTLVLESLAAAIERGARIYGEILGVASSSEAQGIFPLREDGAGLTQAIAQVLQAAQLTHKALGMITTHGNGTLTSDAIEASVIQKLFGESSVPVTAFKWALGHTIASAGTIETMLTLIALGEGKVPGIANLSEPADECACLRISNRSQNVRSAIGLIINRAFSGLTSCLVVTSEVV